LAIGAGFLMLTPLALGLFQARVTFDQYELTKTNLGQPKAILIAVLGFCILPSYFLIQATLDKRSLNASLEYFYSHDTSKSLLSKADIRRSSSTLLQLRNRKRGLQLPYISGFYNHVVFGNMVLSDAKISRMYELLTGDALPAQETLFFGPRGNIRNASFRGRRVIAPEREVSIRSLEVFETSKSKSTIRLTLENALGDTHSLFVGQLNVPEGVFITGLRLKIEDDWVAGKVFDRKTALWVFQKITEIRRDPALLYYHSSNQAELRVYPFPSMGIREVEIDFQHHPKIDSKITIGDRKLDLNPAFNDPSIITQSGITLLDEGFSSLAFQREPYIHFILDYSSHAAETRNYATAIARVTKELNVANFHITAANIAVSSLATSELLNTSDIELITKHIDNIQLRKTGGLWVQQAMAKEILRISKNMNQATFKQPPICVVIINRDRASETGSVLDAWSWLIPDMQGWYSYTNNQLKPHQFGSSEIDIQTSNVSTGSVVAIEQGSSISIFPSNRSSIYKANTDKEIRIFDPSDNRFIPLTLTGAAPKPKSNWANRADIWLDWKVANLNPSTIEMQRSDFTA
jgi:hypothetical protein